MADSSEGDSDQPAAGTDDAVTVSELNDRIASIVAQTDQLQRVRCRGEVTDLHRTETALYFTLTDGQAELPCLIWANRYEKMNSELEDGTAVILEGNIDFWADGGKLNLKPWEITIVGEGEQAAAVDRLRRELDDRGWFAETQKQPVPRFPDRVGVVTSLQGDARYDIQTAIHDQDPTVDILIKDTAVQGANAPESIANGIHHLDRSEDVDVIITGRGGGSDTDLQAFNTEPVAEALFTAETPVVTAIGHTDDRLIADQVADLHTITPTAAGEAVVESRDEFLASTLDPLEQELETTYEQFQQTHEHEAELDAAVEEARELEGVPPVYYKIAIVVLVVLLVLVTLLWIGGL